MNDIETLTQEIQKLKDRNRKVETNKAWETSFTRKILLMLVTYFIAGVTFMVIKNSDPWINAIIPTVGFFLSTLTLSFIKSLWEKYFYKN